MCTKGEHIKPRVEIKTQIRNKIAMEVQIKDRKDEIEYLRMARIMEWAWTRR